MLHGSMDRHVHMFHQQLHNLKGHIEVVCARLALHLIEVMVRPIRDVVLNSGRIRLGIRLLVPVEAVDVRVPAHPRAEHEGEPSAEWAGTGGLLLLVVREGAVVVARTGPVAPPFYTRR
eukprot:CAMPEP_0198216162 /NCGR_PEP_ID=MMETSP1445-20131203/55479_1 /TAXON_ID=36898 /ORGANISM="Pyramimonas sp., Strain CCMP2087" /LENGTH=118 /DNA_ID=CAMNT_0043892275 /DNA_START=81 /DNA_END=433 /DNA_ORIENTATION=+